MHNLKKVVAVIAVLAMVLGTMVTGFAAPAFSDVSGTDYEDAVARLGVLGVMNGYPDGTFKPGNQITRTEFATLVVRALGLEGAAKLTTAKPAFSDVNADYQWAWGYITVATEQGIIKGYPDGTFGPAKPVTYAEAVAMLVRALGYEPAVTGTWPVGYLAKGSELGITDSVKVTADGYASRGDVAVMLDNSLEIDMMEQVGFGDTVEYKVPDNPKNLLEDKIGVDKIEGKVTDYDADENIVTIDVNDEEDDYDVAEGVSFEGLVGADVTAWKLGGKIVYVDVDSSIIYDLVADVTLDGSDVTKVKLSRLDKTYKVAADYQDEIGLTADDESATYGKFIINDGKITSFDEIASVGAAAVVREVSTTKGKEALTYQIGDADERTIKLDGKDVLVLLNNSLAKLADLKADDIVYVDRTNDDYDYVLIAYRDSVEGKLEKIGDDYLTIDGKNYDRADTVWSSINDGEDYANAGDDYDESGIHFDLLKEDVVAYKGVDGKVVYVKGDVEATTTSFYGFALSVSESLDTYKVKVLKADGTTATYEMDADVYDEYFGSGYDSTTDDLAKLYKFEIDEDNIITGVKSTYTQEEVSDLGVATAVKSGYVVIGGTTYYFDDDFFVLNVEDALDANNITSPSKAEVVDWETIVDADSVDGLKGYMFINRDTNGDTYAFVITAGYDNVAGESDQAFVKNIDKVGKDEYEITLDDGTEEFTVVFTDLGNNTTDDLLYNVIDYRLNSDDEGMVKGINTDDPTVVDAVYSSDREIVVGGTTYKVDRSALIFDLNDGDPDYATLGDLKALVDEETLVNVNVKVKLWIDDVSNIVKAIIFDSENPGLD
ncbi:MAG: S-layer homology domain-containing protein [Thermoanaerobacteraceae bacterium]|nr:S-layer homology domain-containing protein [Thermoanaerobacteraceae bacterium]